MKYILATSVLLALGACATGVDTGTQTQRQYVEEKTVETNEEGEEIICRTDDATGSRVRKNKRCGTQAQWDLYDDDSRRHMNKMTRGGAENSS